MISVSEAKQLILTKADSFKRKKHSLHLSESTGLVLSKDIKAACFSPPFDQAAMDGYAFCYAEAVINKGRLNINGEVKAGDFFSAFHKNSAVRIFTGARIPAGADTVIQQEKVQVNGNEILFSVTDCFKGENIRKKGSQFRKGETVLRKETCMNAAGIAVAAMAGHTHAEIFSRPKVSVIVTGNELAKPGAALKPGETYESNSLMLASLLREKNYGLQMTLFIKDRVEPLKKAIEKALNNSDVLLISGGISVGKYDLVKDVLASSGVKTIFHKVKQKPGKPLYFGNKGNKFVFGLPGNPAASMTCFYEYVLPFLNHSARTHQNQHRIFLPLAADYSKKNGLTHFLKGKCEDGKVRILPDQESYKLTSFVEADCLIVIPEICTALKKGELVECHLI